MKYLTLVLLTSATAIQATEFTPIIRQTSTYDDGRAPVTQLLSGVSGITGSVVAAEPISLSAKFELFSIATSGLSGITNGSLDLNSVLVTSHDVVKSGGYTPVAKIYIDALDRLDGHAMTRAESPFSVTIEVSGLLTEEGDAQEAAKTVNVYHSYTRYDKDSFSVDGLETVTSPENPVSVSENGTYSHRENVITQIISPDAESLRGEEIISVYALPDFGFETPTRLDSEKIIVAPMTTGSLHGIENGETYKASIPDVSASLTNIYPGKSDILENRFSTWSVIAYAGSPKSKVELTPQFREDHVTTSVATGFTKPESVSFNPTDNSRLQNYIKNTGAGTYTVELLQTTVHGLDRLDRLTFDYAPEVRINAGINSAE